MTVRTADHHAPTTLVLAVSVFAFALLAPRGDLATSALISAAVGGAVFLALAAVAIRGANGRLSPPQTAALDGDSYDPYARVSYTETSVGRAGASRTRWLGDRAPTLQSSTVYMVLFFALVFGSVVLGVVHVGPVDSIIVKRRLEYRTVRTGDADSVIVRMPERFWGITIDSTDQVVRPLSALDERPLDHKQVYFITFDSLVNSQLKGTRPQFADSASVNLPVRFEVQHASGVSYAQTRTGAAVLIVDDPADFPDGRAGDRRPSQTPTWGEPASKPRSSPSSNGPDVSGPLETATPH